jgi:hypothetical protein
MMAQNLSVLNQRPDRAQELWETDQEAAQEYLLGEDKIYAAKGGKGKDGKEANPLREQAKQALVKAAQGLYRAGFAAGELPSPENWAAFEEAKLNLIQARADYADAGGDPNKILDSQSQVMTTVKSLQELKNTIANIKGKETGTVNSVLDKIQDTIREIANKPKVQNWTNSAQLLSTSADQIQMYIDDFEKWKTQPNVLFGAVKELGKAIEPGLQVTEGEVAGFLGQNRVSAFIGGLQEIGESFKAAFGFDAKDTQAGAKLLRKMQEAAATDQPEVLKDILIQASNVIANAQNSYGKFIFEAKENAENIGGPEIKARARHLDATDKANIKASVDQYIDSQFSNLAMFSQMQRQTPGGPLVPSQGATPPAGAGDGEWDTDFTPYAEGESYKGPQFYADGTEVSLTDDWRKLRANELEAKKGAGKGAKASPTKNPIKGQASAGAAEMSDKVVDDLLAQGGY